MTAAPRPPRPTRPPRPGTAPGASAVSPGDAGVGHALPARQARSRDLRDRLLASARVLVDGGDFAGMSMAQIARAAGCSVGVLYQRFKDKDALFDSVVQIALDEALERQRASLARERYDGRSLEETIALCVADYLEFVRQHEGLVRALYQRTLINAREWIPLRGAAYTMVLSWVDAIVRCAGRAGDEVFHRRAMVSFQFLSGALVHAVLVQPIVIGLHDEGLQAWLTEMMTGMIKGGPGEPVSLTRAARVRLSVVGRRSGPA